MTLDFRKIYNCPLIRERAIPRHSFFAICKSIPYGRHKRKRLIGTGLNSLLFPVVSRPMYLVEQARSSWIRLLLRQGQPDIGRGSPRTSVKWMKGLTLLPAGAPKHGRMRGCSDGSGGITAGGSQLDCVPRTCKTNRQLFKLRIFTFFFLFFFPFLRGKSRATPRETCLQRQQRGKQKDGKGNTA